MAATDRGYVRGISLHLIVAGADAAAAWYGDVFGAEERSRMTLPDGRLIDVQLSVGESSVVLADEFPEQGALGPTRSDAPPAVFYLHVDDVDAVWARAIATGAEVVRPLHDAVWGEREGQLTDPFNHRWGVSQHVRDVPLVEKTRLVTEAMGM
jgi:PhnB protein